MPWASVDRSFHLFLVGERRADFASYPYYRFAIAVGSGLFARVFGEIEKYRVPGSKYSRTYFLYVVFLSRFLSIFLDFLFFVFAQYLFFIFFLADPSLDGTDRLTQSARIDQSVGQTTQSVMNCEHQSISQSNYLSIEGRGGGLFF